MKRYLVVCALAACGDNVEPVDETEMPAPIEAVCNEGELDQLVSKLPNVVASKVADCGNFVEGAAKCFDVTISQPVNHMSPGATFKQKLWVMHRGCDRPTVVADWGYSQDVFFDDELSTLFGANAIWIEHRYQGASTPVGVDWDWTQLTIENGAHDMHRAIDSFKHLYGGNWVSTGASKGGITATYHSYFFPDDLDGFVPYVAPASLSRADASYQIYLDSRLVSACAQRIRDVQVAALTTRRTMMLTRISGLFGPEYAEIYLDSLTASFDWGFWQYRGQQFCNRVPASTVTDDVFWRFFAEMSGISGPRLPADDDVASDGALYYEWMTEQGFALQIGAHVRDLLQSESATSTLADTFGFLFPDVPLPIYDGSVTRATRHWAKHYAENMLLIYGEFDPWSGGSIETPERATSARFFAPGATHGASISGLTPADRTVALAHAARMFGVQPMMPMMSRAAEASANRDAILTRHQQRSLTRLP
jgi:hypothetical protein